MKGHFAGYYSMKQDEAKKIIENSIIVLDAESLFTIFRVKSDYQEELIKVLESDFLKDKLWMPYDVAWLYHKHINDVIQLQLKETDSFLTNLNKCENILRRDDHYPHLNKEILDSLSNIIENVKSYRSKLLDTVREQIRGNGVKDKLANIYNNKVGPNFEQGHMDNIAKDAEDRVRSNKPPYCYDVEISNKQERYHSLIVWDEMITHAKAVNKDIIYVTSCINENWFHIVNDEAISMRNELIDEFHIKAGQSFYCWELKMFLNEYFESKKSTYGDVNGLLKAVNSRIEYNSITLNSNKDNQTNG
jgi:hypothetical protein